MFWFFGPKACGISAPRPGIESASPALEGDVLTTGPPGKSPRKVLKEWPSVGGGPYHSTMPQFLMVFQTFVMVQAPVLFLMAPGS